MAFKVAAIFCIIALAHSEGKEENELVYNTNPLMSLVPMVILKNKGSSDDNANSGVLPENYDNYPPLLMTNDNANPNSYRDNVNNYNLRALLRPYIRRLLDNENQANNLLQSKPNIENMLFNSLSKSRNVQSSVYNKNYRSRGLSNGKNIRPNNIPPNNTPPNKPQFLYFQSRLSDYAMRPLLHRMRNNGNNICPLLRLLMDDDDDNVAPGVEDTTNDPKVSQFSLVDRNGKKRSVIVVYVNDVNKDNNNKPNPIQRIAPHIPPPPTSKVATRKPEQQGHLASVSEVPLADRH